MEIFIYVLLDPRNDHVKYVGKSNNPDKRFKSHISEALKKRKTKKQKWIAYLLSNNLMPTLKIIHECTINNFEHWEEFYIKKYKNYGYNLTNYDDKGIGTPSNMKKQNTNKKNSISKKVEQYDLNGIYLNTYKSLREAEKHTGINHGNISKVCKNKYKHSGGYIFKYKDDSKIINQLNNPNSVKKSVCELDNNGRIIQTWNSLMDCARSENLDNGNLSKVCNGIINNYKKRNFKFYEN